ncbi:MAG: exopolysaccharide biosynthesis protein [Rhizobiaceae bacterium]
MDDLTADSALRASPAPRRLSVIISQLAQNATGPVSIEQIRDALGDRSFAAMLAFFAVLNLVPFPPGTTLILGPPLVIVAVQMALGHHRVWLPKFVLRKSVSRERFVAMTERHLPRLLRLETLIRPRHWPFTDSGLADRIIGWFALVLSIAVTIPIPLGNWLPALGILLIAFALSERDGILFYAGVFVGTLALVVIAAVIGAAGAAAGILFG